MTKRKKEMAAWAVANFSRWPIPYETPDADPSEIGCELAIVPEESTLPILRCMRRGGHIDSSDWFYAKRNKGKPPNP